MEMCDDTSTGSNSAVHSADIHYSDTTTYLECSNRFDTMFLFLALALDTHDRRV